MRVRRAARAWAGAMLHRLASVVGGAPGEPEDVMAEPEGAPGPDDEDDLPVPPQDPLTPAARALMWHPTPRPVAPPPPPPPDGSIQARVQAARGSR